VGGHFAADVASGVATPKKQPRIITSPHSGK